MKGRFMDKRIIDRVILEGEYIIKTGDTVRDMALVFGVSKSTVHKDLKDRLLEIDKDMYDKVMKILKYHSCVRHIRGGESTRRKFLVKNANL